MPRTALAGNSPEGGQCTKTPRKACSGEPIGRSAARPPGDFARARYPPTPHWCATQASFEHAQGWIVDQAAQPGLAVATVVVRPVLTASGERRAPHSRQGAHEALPVERMEQVRRDFPHGPVRVRRRHQGTSTSWKPRERSRKTASAIRPTSVHEYGTRPSGAGLAPPARKLPLHARELRRPQVRPPLEHQQSPPRWAARRGSVATRAPRVADGRPSTRSAATPAPPRPECVRIAGSTFHPRKSIARAA